ncbi:MAG: hypothetical protein QOH83_1671 [Solirubrobacteraceae bacterium]|nr:hypothetical protein [Solirubrobacteraceae bacterium]
MARVEPLRALHYDPAVAGPLQDLAAPPYDVIDPEQRAELASRAAHNVVEIDLPEDPDGGDRYAHAAALLDAWRAEGAVVQDDEPALWAIVQDYTGPDGRELTRNGFFARVRIEDYGPGTIRPHERTHPGPKEDRLRLTRATQANLSPIFSLYSDPELRAWRALEPATHGEPFGEVTDPDGTHNRLWRIADPGTIAAVQDAISDAELLIADGHHRYETARVYADEVGGEGPHRYVLMCLVALQDEGLTVFPTHRLVDGLKDTDKPEALATTLKQYFDIEPIELEDLVPPGEGNGTIQMGYMDSHFKRAFRLTLKDQAIADEALPGMPEPYRRLDTAVLEALVLTGPLQLSEDDISHLKGLGYARSFEEARELVESGTFDAGFFLRGIPVAQIQDIAAAGVNMPPKSTYFFPKVPTGMLFNALTDRE